MPYYNRRRTKKGKQFSKIWLVSCIVISVIFTTASYVLAAFDKNPVSELSAAVIEAMWGTSGVSFAGYALQNCVRAFTESKFGIPKKGDETDDT
ncbi:MAG: hypothetical protein IK093_12175 [Ruminiclostridium sp.]|nr:hypothetical protein [Ruminiclostridium sp.]